MSAEVTALGGGTLPRFLGDPALRIVVVGGHGGVGKSTVSCATAIARAELFPARRTVLLSADPAQSLPRILGSDPLPPNLALSAEPAGEAYRRFQTEQHEALQDLTAALADTVETGGIDPASLSLPGVDEVMNYLTLARIVGGDVTTTVVVDTAPIGHALRLLSTGAALRAYCEALESVLAKRRYLATVYRRTAPARDFPADQLLDRLRGEIGIVESLLHDWARCNFVAVFRFGTDDDAAAMDLAARLRELRVAVRELVFNAVPEGTTADVPAEVLARLARCFDGVKRGRWMLPRLAHEPAGVQALRRLAQSFRPAMDSGCIVEPPPIRRGLVTAGANGEQLRMLPPGALPWLILVTGKGGTGKTTIATALAIAARRAGIDTTLLDAAPGGGLARLLAMPLSAPPSSPVAGFRAAQADPAGEWSRLRAKYTEELSAVTLGSGEVEPVFERRALEALVELAPPGIDECFGLLAIDAALDDAARNAPATALLVADMAPTGHFLRLLDIPAQVGPWLKAIVEALDQHAHSLPMPATRDALARMLARLTRMDALLRDPQRCTVVITTEPATLATSESVSLAEGLARRGIAVGALVINRVGPDADAQAVSTQLAAACPGVRQIALPELSGVSGLEIAHALASAFAFSGRRRVPDSGATPQTSEHPPQ